MLMKLSFNNNETHGSILIREFLRSPDNYISGATLAKLLGVSRVSIWSNLTKLKNDGFQFNAVTNRGYKLTGLPKVLHEDLLNAYLMILNSPIKGQVVNQTDSTMNEAQRLIASGHQPPFFIIAKKQTAGRGRLGRVWESNSQGSLFISLVAKPVIPLQKLPSITPLFAVYLAKLLNEKFSLNSQVKWPNDILLNGKKICGILAETRVDPDAMLELVFGVGLNVNGDKSDWPASLKLSATTIQAEQKKIFDINLISAELISCFFNLLNRIQNQDKSLNLTNLWKQFDCLHETTINGTMNGQGISGIVKGVDQNGFLQLLLPNGKMAILSAGEITLNQEYKKLSK